MGNDPRLCHGTDLRSCQTEHTDVAANRAAHQQAIEAEKHFYEQKAATDAAYYAQQQADAAHYAQQQADAAAAANQQQSGASGGWNNSGGSGGGSGSGGGNDGSDGQNPRPIEAHGYFYDGAHLRQVESGSRGITTEQVAQLPGEALWKAETWDRLRDEPGIVYFDPGSANQYTAYNFTDPNKPEVIQNSNRNNPGFKVDPAVGKRQVSLLRHAKKWFSKSHHRSFVVEPHAPGPLRRHRVAGLRSAFLG